VSTSTGEKSVFVSRLPTAPKPAPTTGSQGIPFCGYNMNLSLTVTGATAGDGSIKSYQWQKGGVDITGASGATKTTYTELISATATYAVKVTNSHDCTTTSPDVVVKVAGTEVGTIGTALTGEVCLSAAPGTIGTAVTCTVSASGGAIGF
jgi:hypothetical protein